MKKIWPWLLLLLLLIFFCVWSKKDNIHVSSSTHPQPVLVQHNVQGSQYVDYTLVQKNDQYTLSGNFKNIKQQTHFGEILAQSGEKLIITNTSTNETLQGDPAVALTNKILPHFAKHYNDGKIAYHNQKLTVYGTVDNYEAQRQMQRLLNSTTLNSSDESNVHVATMPIAYAIHKDNKMLHAEGIFNDVTQINQIKSHLPTNTTSNFQVKENHTDTGSLSIVEKFLPIFLSQYTKGDIIYAEEKLTVTGNVHSQAELDEVNALLANTTILVSNQTVVDPDILAQEAAEQARIAALSAEEKARQEAAENAALAARQAQDEAKKQAKLDAEQEAKRQAEAAEKARREAEKAEAEKQAKLDAEQEAKRQSEAAEKARLEIARAAAQARLAEEAKEAEMKSKLVNLFKLENIEFNVNKSTLTSKGQATVNKLATILKEYPSVRIEIAGHTDSDGSATYNQKLSQSRVDMVKTKLIAQAIDATRLVARGYGETKPLVPNTTRTNKAKNRRVEINILGE